MPKKWSLAAKFLLILILAGVVILILAVLAPPQFYFNFYSLFQPRAIQINNQNISWGQLEKELDFVSSDKALKNRGQKVKRAIDIAIERQILRQFVGGKASPPESLDSLTEIQEMKKIILSKSVNWRSGGYFIARFVIPQATESAVELKSQARSEISKLKVKLDKGESFQRLLKEATQDGVLIKLNAGAFLPGVYLDQVTEESFPLKIKSFRNSFFSLPIASPSGILTLSWDDYDGPSYSNSGEFKGDFAYGVIKIDQGNKAFVSNYNQWLKEQVEKANIQSFVFTPFYFKWL